TELESLSIPLCLPHDLVESLDAPVQVVLTVIAGQRVFDAAQAKLPPGDAIAVTADYCSEVWVTLQVPVERIETKQDIAQLPVTIGDLQRYEDAAKICDGRLDPLGVCQRVQFDSFTGGRLAELLLWSIRHRHDYR